MTLLVQNLHPIGSVDIMGDGMGDRGGNGIELERGGITRMEENHPHANHDLIKHIQRWHRVFVDCDVHGSPLLCNNDDRLCNNDDRAEDPCERGGTMRTTHQLSGDTEDMIESVLEYRKESCVLLQTIYTTWPGMKSNSMLLFPDLTV